MYFYHLWYFRHGYPSPKLIMYVNVSSVQKYSPERIVLKGTHLYTLGSDKHINATCVTSC